MGRIIRTKIKVITDKEARKLGLDNINYICKVTGFDEPKFSARFGDDKVSFISESIFNECISTFNLKLNSYKSSFETEQDGHVNAHYQYWKC